MSVTLTISEKAFKKLQSAAIRQGFMKVEKFLENWNLDESELIKRRELVERIDARREKIFKEIGLMSDSAEIVREDRERR